jgi:hypothetical protein
MLWVEPAPCPGTFLAIWVVFISTTGTAVRAYLVPAYSVNIHRTSYYLPLPKYLLLDGDHNAAPSPAHKQANSSRTFLGRIAQSAGDLSDARAAMVHRSCALGRRGVDGCCIGASSFERRVGFEVRVV